MNLFRFAFPFLYTRDWHTGAYEISRPRIVLFSAMLFLILLAIIIVAILQSPVKYSV